MTWLVERRATAENREAMASAQAEEEAAHLAQALRISKAAPARSTPYSSSSSSSTSSSYSSSYSSSSSSSASFEGEEYVLTFEAGGLGLSVAVGKLAEYRGLPSVCRADGPTSGSPKHRNAGPNDAHLPRVGHVVLSFKSNTSNGFGCSLATLGDPDTMYDALIDAVSACTRLNFLPPAAAAAAAAAVGISYAGIAVVVLLVFSFTFLSSLSSARGTYSFIYALFICLCCWFGDGPLIR